MRVAKDLTGLIYGRWHVVSRGENSRGRMLWNCICLCGQEALVNHGNLINGKTSSCGCLHKERISTHGFSQTIEFRVWKGMVRRCKNPKSANFKNYGGRGIKVCSRWLKFKNFLADMGKRPSLDYSIERKNNDGNYDPSNCVWATHSVQHNNRSDNHRLTLGEKTLTIAEWSKLLGIGPSTISNRIKAGWDVNMSLSTNVKIKRPRNSFGQFTSDCIITI